MLVSLTPLRSAELLTAIWKTQHASPPAQLKADQAVLLPLIQLGVATVPEPAIMQLTFIGGSALGLTPEHAEQLHDQLSALYLKINEDDLYGAAPSALPYCYSNRKPDQGFATIYAPNKTDKNTPVILFLHGYGGSFTFYSYYFQQSFPNHLIICPAFGISMANVNSEYLSECMDAVSKKLKHPLHTPTLIGLSAGGRGGAREYARQPHRYLGYIGMAAYVPKDVINVMPQNGRIRFVAGKQETFVTNNVFQRHAIALKKRCPDFQAKLIPEANHFFMLTAEDPTRKLLKQWVDELENK